MKKMGVHVHHFNLGAALERNIKYGRPGRMFASRFPVEPWIAGANRELIVEAMERKPDVLLVAGAMQVRAGALAQIKVSCPEVSIVLFWPDTLLNLAPHTLAALPIYDLVASYSSTAIPQFEKLGARRLAWLPFAADPQLFPADVHPTSDEAREMGCDVGFVGNHRPERERAILRLLDAGLSVKVWGGSSWVKQSIAPNRVKAYYQGKTLEGHDSVKAVQASKISLNVIDQTNYPAANMRFFETHACGGVSLSSRCPELETEFPDLETTRYFDEDNLEERARELIADEPLRHKLAKEGMARALRNHTYEHRSKELFELLDMRE